MIPIAKPDIGEVEVQAAAGALRSGWVSQGPRVAEFERAFAACVGAEHACAVSSCTTALHLALLTVGVKPGDEVVTVSHSFIATANSIRYCGAIPAFVDIEPDTYNMDPGLIEPAITERTKAILCVHQMGMPCDMPAITEIASRHGLPVIEDAACAIGSEIRVGSTWERIGKPHGDIACFSFHPRKVITTGEGGMLTTRNPEWDAQFRLLRQHCMSVPDTKRHSSAEVIFEGYPAVGFNYRMTDMQAAVGCEQLKRLTEIVDKRRELAHRYGTLLAAISGPRSAPRARMGPQQLAELLHPAPGGRGPKRRHAEHARRWRRHPPRDYVLPSRGRLSGRHLDLHHPTEGPLRLCPWGLRRSAAERRGPRSLHRTALISTDDGRGTKAGGRHPGASAESLTTMEKSGAPMETALRE